MWHGDAQQKPAEYRVNADAVGNPDGEHEEHEGDPGAGQE